MNDRFFAVFGQFRQTALSFLIPMLVQGQVVPPDSGASTPNGRRTLLVATGSVVMITGALVALDQAWYDQYEDTAFHFFDDGAEWRGMDKAGHCFSAYTTAEWGTEMFHWAGADPGIARWVGGTMGWAFLTGVEILDGFSKGWGFSAWDIVANTAGTGVYITQDALWQEQRFRLKYSAHLTSYAEQRPDLLGESLGQRLLKDYNGQTYWLSFCPVSFAEAGNERGWPRWLNIALGYGADGMTSARIPAPGEVIVGSTSVRRSRFLLSPDVDLRRVKVKSRFLRTALDVLNCIKVPAPALEIGSDGTVRGHWLYF